MIQNDKFLEHVERIVAFVANNLEYKTAAKKHKRSKNCLKFRTLFSDASISAKISFIP